LTATLRTDPDAFQVPDAVGIYFSICATVVGNPFRFVLKVGYDASVRDH
jgi:hypothetical protein